MPRELGVCDWGARNGTPSISMKLVHVVMAETSVNWAGTQVLHENWSSFFVKAPKSSTFHVRISHTKNTTHHQNLS